MYVNYRAAHDGYAATGWTWNAGSGSTYANFTLGGITAKSNVSVTGSLSCTTTLSVGSNATVSGNLTVADGKYIAVGTPGGSGAANKANYISAGPGYSTSSGRYGVKVLTCDQNNCQSGLGQDLACKSGWANNYNHCIVAGHDTYYGSKISFVTHPVNSTTYTYLGGFSYTASNAATEFNVNGVLSVAGTSTLTGAVTANSKISTFDDIYLKRLEDGQPVNYGQIGFQKIGNSFYTFFTVPAFSSSGGYGGPGLLILTDSQGISSLKYTDNFTPTAQESDSYEIWHAGNSNRNTKNWAAKNLSAAGTLSVTSTSTLTGAVTCSNNLSVASGLVTAQDLTVTRNLVIPKTAPVSAASGNYYLYVNPSGSYSE